MITLAMRRSPQSCKYREFPKFYNIDDILGQFRHQKLLINLLKVRSNSYTNKKICYCLVVNRRNYSHF